MELSKKEKAQIVERLAEEGAEKVELFGSYARENADQDSDVDLLVKFSTPKTLLDVARIERQLGEKIGKEVDLVTEESLSPHIADKIKHREVLQA
jgi:predicted nucleotidyltransferase